MVVDRVVAKIDAFCDGNILKLINVKFRVPVISLESFKIISKWHEQAGCAVFFDFRRIMIFLVLLERKTNAIYGNVCCYRPGISNIHIEGPLSVRLFNMRPYSLVIPVVFKTEGLIVKFIG